MAGKKIEEAMAPETPVAEAKATGKKAKVYKFTSANKYLSCFALGVQFIDGKASTTNLEVARKLAKIEGVTLVEE